MNQVIDLPSGSNNGGAAVNPAPTKQEVLSTLIASFLRDSLAGQMTDAVIESLGIDPAKVVQQLIAAPQAIRLRQQEVNEARDALRESNDLLKELEWPLKYQANAEGKNTTEREARFVELTRANTDIADLRKAIAKADLALKDLEAQRDEQIERSKNGRRIAQLLSAILGIRDCE